MFGFRRPVVTADQPVKPVDATIQPQPTVDGVPVSNTVQAVPVVAESTYVNSRWDDFRLSLSQRIQDIIGFVFSVGAVLIVVRFVLLATGANPDGQFAQLVLAWSQRLVAPFLTLFSNPAVPHFQIFEVGDVIAVAVYAIATGLLCYLVGLLLNPTMRSRRVLVIQ